MKLTDTACRNAKAQTKAYKNLTAAAAFYLEIMPNGNKLWRLKYYYLGTEKRVSLGAYPIITLARRGKIAIRRKKLLAQDIDSTARRDRKQQIIREATNTFEIVALEWFENQRDVGAINTQRKFYAA